MKFTDNKDDVNINHIYDKTVEIGSKISNIVNRIRKSTRENTNSLSDEELRRLRQINSAYN